MASRNRRKRKSSSTNGAKENVESGNSSLEKETSSDEINTPPSSKKLLPTSGIRTLLRKRILEFGKVSGWCPMDTKSLKQSRPEGVLPRARTTKSSWRPTIFQFFNDNEIAELNSFVKEKKLGISQIIYDYITEFDVEEEDDNSLYAPKTKAEAHALFIDEALAEEEYRDYADSKSYAVKEIRGKKSSSWGEAMYLVIWQDGSKESWEPKSNLLAEADKIAEFERKKKEGVFDLKKRGSTKAPATEKPKAKERDPVAAVDATRVKRNSDVLLPQALKKRRRVKKVEKEILIGPYTDTFEISDKKSDKTEALKLFEGIIPNLMTLDELSNLEIISVCQNEQTVFKFNLLYGADYLSVFQAQVKSEKRYILIWPGELKNFDHLNCMARKEINKFLRSKHVLYNQVIEFGKEV